MSKTQGCKNFINIKYGLMQTETIKLDLPRKNNTKHELEMVRAELAQVQRDMATLRRTISNLHNITK